MCPQPRPFFNFNSLLKRCHLHSNWTKSVQINDLWIQNMSKLIPSYSEMKIHSKCRNTTYGNSGTILRAEVPDEKVSWDITWEEYSPPHYTADVLKGKPWADKDIKDEGFNPMWNTLDDANKVDRRSFHSLYKIVGGYPLNVIGRTGLSGRGVLGRWGPNHAADPVVTRWKRNSSNDIVHHLTTNKPILQFVCIKRKDNNEWAFPGGMVDPGEVISQTLIREFLEETMNSLEMTTETKLRSERILEEFFSQGQLIYKGYVDDPRNTDNSWMETVAMNFHDKDGGFVGSLRLNAGDDAVGVCWMDVSHELKMYASHSSMLKNVADNLNAHW